MGVRTSPSLHKKAGPESPSGPAGCVVIQLVVVAVGADLFHDPRVLELTPETLDLVLAPDAGQNLRHRPEAGRRNRLLALRTRPVHAVVQAIERCRQAVDSLHQKAPGRESDFATLARLDLVHLVGERRVIPDRPR